MAGTNGYWRCSLHSSRLELLFYLRESQIFSNGVRVSRRRSSAISSSLLNWLSIGMKTAEMFASSAEVIGHRTSRMMPAAPRPSGADRREFGLMQEMVGAAIESFCAMASSLFATNLQIWSRVTQIQLSTAAAMGAFATSRTGAEAIARHAAVARIASRSPLTARQAFDATACLTAKSLAPIRSRAVANAKPLCK